MLGNKILKLFNSQKGAIAPILVVLLLLGGLGVGLYLINKPTNLAPKASGGEVAFVDDSGKQIKETNNPKVKIRVSSPWQTRDGYNYEDCGGGNSFNFIQSVKADSGDEDSNDKNTVSPKPKQSKNPKRGCLVVEEAIISENPNFSDNTTKSFPYTGKSRMMTVDYELSKSLSGVVEPGVRSIYVKFKSTAGQAEQNALPFPATITYTGSGSITSPIPTPTQSSNPNSNKPDLKITNIETDTKKMVFITLCHSGPLLSSSQKYGLKITNKDSNIGGTVEDISNYVWPNRCIGQKVYCKGDCFPGKATSVNMEVEIDPSNVIDESDETNNIYSGTIQKPASWPKGGGDEENCGNC